METEFKESEKNRHHRKQSEKTDQEEIELKRTERKQRKKCQDL